MRDAVSRKACGQVNRRDAKSAEVEQRLSSLRSFASLRFDILSEGEMEPPYVGCYAILL
jgi:hypothetical protein